MDFNAVDDQKKLWFAINDEKNITTLFLKGFLDRTVVVHLEIIISKLQKKSPFSGVIDLTQVSSIDSAGCAFLLLRASGQNQTDMTIGKMSEVVRKTLDLFRYTEQREEKHAESTGLFESTGAKVFSMVYQFQDFLQLSADTTLGMVRSFFNKGLLRWNDLITQSILIGSMALPVVGLIALLIGLTLAFQSAYQLQSFGIDVFVANLTGIAMVREMGPLMTAILVAGRSGSSMAAEIATMKVSEEIDALKVMGIDPVYFLAVPRLLAILLMLPLLTVCADLIGILGGFIVGVLYVGLAPMAYINQTVDSLVLKDVLSGLIKSLIFAWGIGMIGLSYGFKVRGGAEEVGKSTTASVVTSIFYIIIADCIFSIIFYVVL